jgi:hypothetical protein
MKIVRILPKAGELPEVRTFQCVDCAHVVMVEFEG